MSDADKAYAAAKRLIAKAKKAGDTHLSFDSGGFRALTTLPPGLAGLTGLQVLSLDNTGVSDAGLAALQGLTGLITLSVESCTNLRDLRPLKDMVWLVAGARQGAGLQFRGCAATVLDPELERLSQIEDNADRTDQTLAYLRNLTVWPPEIASPPDRPGAPSYVLPIDGPMRSIPEPPEGGDEDQIALQEELRLKVAELIEAAGRSNEPLIVRIRSSATSYQRQVNRPLAAISIKLLWSAANALRNGWETEQAATEQARFNDQLPPVVAGLLRDLVETHGLFIMGFPNAAALEHEMRDFLRGARDPAEVQAGVAVVGALARYPGALAADDRDALEEDAATAQGEGPSAIMAAASLRNRLWNMMGAAGRKAWAFAKSHANKGVALILANDFIQFLYGNETLVMKFLHFAQGEAAIWFPRLLEMLRGLGLLI